MQISLLLLSASTATRPGALLAVSFKNIELIKVRDTKDRKRYTIVANVNLEHVKNAAKNGTPKKFTFRFKELPAFCIVSHILAIGLARNAFEAEFTCIEQIFESFKIPAHKKGVKIKWKAEVMHCPFFCDTQKPADGNRVNEEQAFPYTKYRDVFVRLGLVAGFKTALELYQL